MEAEKARKKERSRKRKLQAVIAIALILALISAGTLAWTSFSQYALNETRGSGNPGGRLHDDFDGGNKDIYVENYGSVPIYARIQLSEYMEIGKNAGKYAEGLRPKDGAGITVLGSAGANIYDRNTWDVWNPDQNATSDLHKTGTHANMPKYFDWVMGGEKIFMPTFDKDSESLYTDLGGSQGWIMGSQDAEYRVNDPDEAEYTTGTGENVGANNKNNPKGSHDYWTAGDTKTDTEYYGPLESPPSKTGVEHTAKKTLNAQVYTMKQWQNALNKKVGPYWVVDADGWAYWAEPIEPGTATGLLLNEITKKDMPKEDWYYAIDALAQFATADDIDAFDDAEGISEDAYELLTNAAATRTTASSVVIGGGSPQYLKEGGEIVLTATAKTDGSEGSSKVTWSTPTSSTDTKIDETSDTSAKIINTKGSPGDLYKKFVVTATSSKDLAGNQKSASTDLWIIKDTDKGVVTGKDGKTYLDHGDGTFQELIGDGTLGTLKEWGTDKQIGTKDDRNVLVLEGKKYVKVDAGEYISPTTGDPNAKFGDGNNEHWWTKDGTDKTPTKQDDLQNTKPANHGGSTEPAGKVSKVEITVDGKAIEDPVTEIVKGGVSKTYTFTPLGSDGKPLSGNDAKMEYTVQFATKSGTKFENGKLTVDKNETASYIVVWYTNSDGETDGLLFEVKDPGKRPELLSSNTGKDGVVAVKATRDTIIKGRSVGDNADWVPIAAKKVGDETYYLITRTELMKINENNDEATRFGGRFGIDFNGINPMNWMKKPFQYYDGSKALTDGESLTSDVYRYVNAYYAGSKDNFLATKTEAPKYMPAKLKEYAVGNDAAEKIGTYLHPEDSSGYSSPVPNQPGSAFVLSFQESTAFLADKSLEQGVAGKIGGGLNDIFGGLTGGGKMGVAEDILPKPILASAPARSNYGVVSDIGDMGQKTTWLRTPGQTNTSAGYFDDLAPTDLFNSNTCTLNKNGKIQRIKNGKSEMLGIGGTTILDWGENAAGIRPCLWVKSSIFDA